MSKYIDIHSHLNLSPLYEDREGVIARMREHETGTIVVGVDYDTSVRAIAIAKEFPGIVLGVTIGLHPADNTTEIFDEEKYLALAQDEKVIAIGECGLDYFRDQTEETKIKQKGLFLKHIILAQQAGKPLMIHARPSKETVDAYEDVLEILEGIDNSPKANFHFFVGDIAIAERALALGCTMSFDGPITFARDYDEVIRFLPLESIMVETDAPFAAPAPHRGKTCEPWMVSEIAQKIAEIKNLPIEKVEKQLFLNAKRFFAI